MSFLCVDRRDLVHLNSLLGGPCEPCISQLPHYPNMCRQLVLGIAATCASPCLKTKFYEIFDCTLLATQCSATVIKVVEEALKSLESLNLMEFSQTTRLWNITNLGRAAHASAFECDIVSFIKKSIECFQTHAVLSSDLHLIGLVTPYELAAAYKPNYQKMWSMWARMKDPEKEVMRLLGVDEPVLVRHMMGNAKGLARSGEKSEYHKQMFTTDTGRLRRCYLTLVIWNIVQKQRTVYQTAEELEIDAGRVQSLLQSAAIYASSMSSFCKELPTLWRVGLLTEGLIKRLYFGVQQEILALMDIPFMRPGRARTLVDAGYVTPKDIACAKTGEMVERVGMISVKQCEALIAAAKVFVKKQASELMDEGVCVVCECKWIFFVLNLFAFPSIYSFVRICLSVYACVFPPAFTMLHSDSTQSTQQHQSV
eukprot:m.97707 g.97707  ORF g.97707 m.97707 type:complete len:425 (+) comp12500_c1_seq8:66-1340(+)